MNDSQNRPDPNSPEKFVGPDAAPESNAQLESPANPAPEREPAGLVTLAVTTNEDAASRRRSFRRNLYLLLSLSLAAFILTSWILVRVDSPFGLFSNGPQELVRAQLRALDRGELRPAYDMFSARYRGQVSFDAWHELCLRHWRMFHGSVVREETTSQIGPGATLEIFLHGADNRDYRALFNLIRSDGRWWIDDVHWTQEPDARNFVRI